MTGLERARAEINLARVQMARKEMEFSILEHQEKIDGLKDVLKKQIAAEEKLSAELKQGA